MHLMPTPEEVEKPLFDRLHELGITTKTHRHPPVHTVEESKTLRGSLPDLAPGDVLVLEEVRGPLSGAEADADPAHRHAVRLTEVVPAVDPIGDPSGGGTPLDVTEIAWHAQDALPFAFCISSEASMSSP